MLLSIFFIKTITHWPPLYTSKNCSYFVLKLLPKATSWPNSPFPFVINNCFSPLPYSPYINDDVNNGSRLLALN